MNADAFILSIRFKKKKQKKLIKIEADFAN